MMKAIAGGVLMNIAFVGLVFAQTCPAATYVPYTFTNGSTADASQVNSNFTSLLNCANTNLAPLTNPHFTGDVGVGTNTPAVDSNGGRYFAVSGEGVAANKFGEISIGGNITSSAGAYGSLNFYNSSLGTTDKRTAAIFSFADGATNSGNLNFFTWNAGTAASRMYISSGGNVGIGTASPSYLLTVNGTAYASGAAGALSDIRHKDKVATVKPGALQIVGKLRPVTFVWKDPKDDGMKGEQIGFIAQEVQKVLPSVVLTEKNAEKTLALKYTEIIPVLTAAIQEQQAEIESLKAQVAALKASH